MEKFRITVSNKHNDVAIFAKGAGIALPGRVIGRGIVFSLQVILARFLGPAGYGLYGIGWTILTMGERIATLGLEEGVVRFASRERARNNVSRMRGVIYQSMLLAVCSGTILGIVLYLSAPWLSHQVFQKPELLPVLRYFSPAFSLIAGLQIAAAITRISQRMQFSILVQDLVQPIVNLVLVLTAFLLGRDIIGAIASLLLSYAIALFLAIMFVRRLFPFLFREVSHSIFMTRELLFFSLPTSFSRVFTSFTFWIDRLFVGYFLSSSLVGIYQSASQIPLFFGVILNAFNAIFAPMIAVLHSKEAMDRVDELFKISTKWAIYISMPLFLTICFASKEMMIVIFNSVYVSGAKPLIIMAVGQLVNASTGSVGILLIMTGNQTRWLKISVGSLLLNFLLSFLLIPRFGLVGGACANAISIGGLFLSGLFSVKSILNLWPYDRRLLKGVSATIITMFSLFFINRVNTSEPLQSLVLIAIASILIFGIGLLLLGLDPEDYEFFDLILSRFRKKEG
jgi:O-antigen/teichoic acid export membrane protein